MSSLRRYIAWGAQNAIYPFLWFIFKIFARLEISYEDPKARNLSGPLLIAANHQSGFDSLVLPGIFPIFSQALPVSFLVWRKLWNNSFAFPFVWAAGATPVEHSSTQRPLGDILQSARQVLERGGAVTIYPQGRVVRPGIDPSEARRGVGWLALATGAPVLPVYIGGTFGMNLFRLFLRKQRVFLRVGKPFRLSGDGFPSGENNEETMRRAAQLILQKVALLA